MATPSIIKTVSIYSDNSTDIPSQSVTLAQIQNLNAVSLLANPTGSAASAQNITLAGGLTFSGTTLVGGIAGCAVATANGFAGSVSAPTTSPSITLQTTVTGLLYGNGTAVAAPTTANFLTAKQTIMQGTARLTGQTAAASLTAFTVGASDASFLVSANVLITTSTLHSFSVTCSYTDESNTARTLTLNFSQLSGTFVQTLTNALGASAYEGVPVHIRCKSGTTITIASTGTFTTVTYNFEEMIQQIS